MMFIKNLVQKFNEYNKFDLFFKLALLLVLISLPLSGYFTRISIILLAISWVLDKNYKNFKWLLNYKSVAFIAFYLMYVIGMFYTEDKHNGYFQLEQKLSLIIFPLIFSTTPKISLGFINKAFMWFVGSCVFATIICLWEGLKLNYFYNNFETINMELLTNQTLAGYIGAHSTYLSIYLLFCVFILINDLVSHKKSFLIKAGVILLIIYLLCFVLLLAARMVILAAVLIFIGSFFVSFFKGIMNFKSFLGLLIVAVIFIGITFQNNYLTNRFKQMYNFNMADLIGSNNENGVTQRIFLWQNGVEIIKKKPIFGSGTGDVNLEMKYQYEKLLSENKNFSPSVIAAVNSFSLISLNAHNQFIQITISIGAIGLIIFLINIGISGNIAYKNKQYLFLSFLVLFFLSCFTECLIERQSGIVFYSFLNSLFVFHYFKNKQVIR
ncbi:MAG: O-antigen ligase family protein [Bacteroidia bacterium]|nr:O-antigen ligase family protein [Bacteroidia bacterium]